MQLTVFIKQIKHFQVNSSIRSELHRVKIGIVEVPSAKNSTNTRNF